MLLAEVVVVSVASWILLDRNFTLEWTEQRVTKIEEGPPGSVDPVDVDDDKDMLIIRGMGYGSTRPYQPCSCDTGPFVPCECGGCVSSTSDG